MKTKIVIFNVIFTDLLGTDCLNELRINIIIFDFVYLFWFENVYKLSEVEKWSSGGSQIRKHTEFLSIAAKCLWYYKNKSRSTNVLVDREKKLFLLLQIINQKVVMQFFSILTSKNHFWLPDNQLSIFR